MSESTERPHVAIVILTWNGKDFVLECLRSLACIKYPNWSATVIDNASADGTADAVRERFPQQRLLVMEKNLGFCGGNNRGITDALERGADYVLLLNNDVEMHPDMLDELVKAAETDPRIGIVGAKNILMVDHNLLWGAYGDLTFGAELVHLAGRFARSDDPQFLTTKDVDWVIGNGMMFKRAELQDVGGFDEWFFGYHEDVDLCLRARQRGWRVVYVGAASIYHHGGAAAGATAKMPFPTVYFLGRNAFLFARKHGTAAQLGVFVARFISRTTLDAFQAWRKGERVKHHLWLLRGFADAVIGRLPLRQLGLQP